MITCGACGGSGKVTCPSCGGRRYHSRFSSQGVETDTCLVCYGTGQARCDFCSGKGSIGTAGAGMQGVQGVQPSPPPRTRPPGADPLEGRWQEPNGNWYKFEKTNTGYRVTAGSAVATTGEGTATLSGNKVTLEVKYLLIGKLKQEFELRENELAGYMNLFGIRLPMMFRPV